MQEIYLRGIALKEFRALIGEIIDEKLSNLPVKQEISNNSDYLSRKDVISLLKISLTTLHEWSKRGIIQSYRIGNRVLYRRDEIEESVRQVKNLKYKRG